MGKDNMNWNPRNDANCEAVQPITQAERERQVAINFIAWLATEGYVNTDKLDNQEKWNDTKQHYDIFPLRELFLQFIKDDIYRSIPPATYGIVIWKDFEADMDALLQAGQTEQAETRPHPTQSEYIAALLESFRLIEPTDSDTKANHRIVLEVFCAWLIGRTDKRPDKWDVNIFLSDGHYNNLQQPPQAKGVSREEAIKWIESKHDGYDLLSEEFRQITWDSAMAMFDWLQSQPVNEGCPLPDQVEPDRFKMPSDKELIEIAILFNDGKIQRKNLTYMVAMAQFILDRLYENGNVTKRSSKELLKPEGGK